MLSNPPIVDTAIEVESLTRRFGSFAAVDQISFRVQRSRIFGLLGPNAAGKSTTIKILTTLLEPTSGHAVVAGFDVVREPAAVRASIGYVSQMLSADGALTGRENLLFSARLYRVPRSEWASRVAAALGFMNLADEAGKLVKNYSGGMIRRLEIAQAMLHRPQVLFLDEPTIGLDPVARRSVWDRLLELRREYAMTVLLTTHDMEEADRLCDELAILHQGKIALAGTPAVLKAAAGTGATLEDVFVQCSGGSINEGGSYRDIRQTRQTAQRLG